MTTTQPAASRLRLPAIDIVRGAVMVLMAIDHVRVYSGQPPGGSTAGIFFTRWVTHFCAPAFVFLAGTGAFLYGVTLGQGRPAAEARRLLARYLVARGLILVLLEVTVIRFSWTFNFDYSHFLLAGVIWMIGWCMVLLAGLVWLPTRAIGWIGIITMAAQQVFHFIPQVFPEALRHAIGPVWEFIYPANLDRFRGVSVLYVIVPWIGVMAAGYAFGSVMLRDQASRRRFCLRVGLSAVGLYVLFAAAMMVFGPPPDGGPMLFQVLNPPKYPASQPFLLMTLGPTITILPFLESARGRVARILETFGRVPLFYYLLHIPVIHLSALLVTFRLEGAAHQEWYATAPFSSVPAEHMWSLPLLYLVLAVDVSVLYLLCRWFAGVKARASESRVRHA